MLTSLNTFPTGIVRPGAERARSIVPVPVASRAGRAAVVLNAHAKRVTPRLRTRLASLVPEQDLFYSTSLEEAGWIARTVLARGYPRILVGGGDGTVATMLGMLLDAAEHDLGAASLPEVGILRLGTGNALAFFAGATDVGRDVARAMSAEAARTRTLRLIEDPNSGSVFPFASLGYDAQVLNDYLDVVQSQRSGWGRRMAKSLSGYLYAIGTRTLPAELNPTRTRLRIVARGRASAIDPQTREEIPLATNATLFEGTARAVSVGTTPYYGFGLKALPDALKRQDRFQVRVSTASVGYLLARLPSLWSGALRSSHLYDFLVEGVSIESSQPLPMQMAGDARGKADRLELRLLDQTFRLIEGTKTPRA